MNLYGKCVCIMLLTVFLGGDGVSSQCDVKKCDDDLNKLTTTTPNVCKNLETVKSCYSTGLKLCTDKDKTLSWVKYSPSVKSLEKTCNGGKASPCDITACSTSFAKLFLNNRSPDTICKKLPDILKCYMDVSKSCTGDEKTYITITIDNFKQLQDAKCNDGQVLKSNIGGLLVVAMMVMVRHFL